MKKISIICTAALLASLILTSCAADANTQAAAQDSTDQTESEAQTSKAETETSAQTETSAETETSADIVVVPDGAAALYTYTSKYSDNYYYAQNTPYENPEDYIIPCKIYICKNSDASAVTSSESRLLIHDGDWLIFDAVSGEITPLAFLDGCENVYIIADSESRELVGYSILKDGFYAFADASGTLKTEYIYTSVDTSSYAGYIFANIQHPEQEYDTFIPQTQYIMKLDGTMVCVEDGWFGAVSNCEDVYFLQYDNPMSIYSFKIYDSNMKLLSDETFAKASVMDDGNVMLMCLDDCDGKSQTGSKHFKVLGRGGSVLTESAEYDTVCYIWKDHAFVVDGGYLKMVGTDGTVTAVLHEWNDDMYFHWHLGGYHTGEASSMPDYYTAIYSVETKDGKPVYTKLDMPEKLNSGLYVSCENRKISYGTGGSGFEFNYVPETGEIFMIENIGIGGYEKPVLYLYPENEQNVSVTFEHPEYLSVSYPEYPVNGWSADVCTDSTLDIGGREYYALYWEEAGSISDDFADGFCVEGEHAAQFLEQKLDALGFTQREANEFIMYWLPVLEKNGISLVRFELTESRQAYNRLNISPAPDSMLRVAIHIKKTDAPQVIKEQLLPEFDRHGFSAVEWGGVNYG
ncbi:MAG: hypothetical protein WCQ72_01730 [Eubacteriales bacterium]